MTFFQTVPYDCCGHVSSSFQYMMDNIVQFLHAADGSIEFNEYCLLSFILSVTNVMFSMFSAFCVSIATSSYWW